MNQQQKPLKKSHIHNNNSMRNTYTNTLWIGAMSLSWFHAVIVRYTVHTHLSVETSFDYHGIFSWIIRCFSFAPISFTLPSLAPSVLTSRSVLNAILDSTQNIHTRLQENTRNIEWRVLFQHACSLSRHQISNARLVPPNFWCNANGIEGRRNKLGKNNQSKTITIQYLIS